MTRIAASEMAAAAEGAVALAGCRTPEEAGPTVTIGQLGHGLGRPHGVAIDRAGLADAPITE